MCGIACYFTRTNGDRARVGNTILNMLNALSSRGPDSAGVALYGPRSDHLILRVKLGDAAMNRESKELQIRADRITEFVSKIAEIVEVSRTVEYLRLKVGFADDLKTLERLIESAGKEVEVVSMGSSLEIIKQVGSPVNLDRTYHLNGLCGSHGIGHTRLSTESSIDLSHSQPFWAHGHPDLAVAHNGHITNYRNMRCKYEQNGFDFYTENDSEIIGVYLGEKLSIGMSLAEAMHSSLQEFDGSFSYLAATHESVGFAKDPFGLKPLLMTETDQFVAIATEEIAIRNALKGEYKVHEAPASEVRVWQL